MEDQELQQETTESNAGNDTLPVEDQIADDSTSAGKELEEQKEKYIRLLAEFENYKRRTAKERIDLFKTAGQDVIKDMLPVLDDIDRAQNAITDAKDVEGVRQGLLLISEKLRTVLQGKGLKEMESKGLDFDSDAMEAVTEIPAAEPGMKGKVVDVLEKGYTLNEKIIRYAKVVVGK